MDAPVAYPDFVARFYDVVYEQHRSGTDTRYYLEQLRAAPGPALEVGVGTGRLFRRALEDGVDVHGVDVNASMLAQLRAGLPAAAQQRVTQQDLRRLDLGRRFALIIAPFRVFSHLLSVEDQLAALQRVAQHLEPEGRLIFDLYVPSHRMLAEGLHDVQDFSGEHAPGCRLERFVSMHADPIAQLSHVTMRYVWHEGGAEHCGSWDFAMRYFFRFELEHLVARSPLALEAIHGDFAAGPLTARSKEFLLVCKRRTDP